MNAKDWIPLAREKPKKPGKYLVFDGDHEWISHWLDNCFDVISTTHWMFLPPPPDPPDPFEIWWNGLQCAQDTLIIRKVAPGCYISKSAASAVWETAINTTHRLICDTTKKP